MAIVICLTGVVLRVLLVIQAGNAIAGPLSGTSDAERYVLLGENVFQGRGLTYAGQATALRAPLYPLFLAASHLLFGSQYLLAVRIMQLFAGAGTAFGCAWIGMRLFGKEAGALSGACALAMPTLVFMGCEIGTEALSAAFITLFLGFFAEEVCGERKNAVALGVTSGLCALLRFNCAVLPIFGAAAALVYRRSLRRALLILAIAGTCVLPWVVRNAMEFHGRILYSSHGGINLLLGVLTPAGRAQPGETELVRGAVGWWHTDVETNNASRLSYPSEEVLDRQARGAAFAAWKQLSWGSRARLLLEKLGYFWLSADQVLELSSFSPFQRIARRLGVAIYLVLLALACVGWRELKSRGPRAAQALAGYAGAITIVHLPFVMNTRLRSPLLDALIAILAGAGLAVLLSRRHAKSQKTVA